MIAKICSDMNKPNGQFYIQPHREKILDFIGSLGVRKIPNIGGMSETTLNAMGFKTGGDLLSRAHDLKIAFTPHMHTFLIKCGLGIGQ